MAQNERMNLHEGGVALFAERSRVVQLERRPLRDGVGCPNSISSLPDPRTNLTGL